MADEKSTSELVAEQLAAYTGLAPEPEPEVEAEGDDETEPVGEDKPESKKRRR